MSFTLEIDGDTRVLTKFNNVENLLKDMSRPLAEAGDLIVSEVDQNFKTEGSRLNAPWAALTAETMAQKVRLGYGSKGILERTGTLRGGFSKEVGKVHVRVKNDVDYYKYHQLGTKHLPQRIMLKTTENIKQDIIEIFNKALINALV